MAGQGTGKSGRGRGRNPGGRGRGGKNAVRSSTTTTTKSTQKGLCAELEGNVFDIGQRASADLHRTTLEKVIQFVGTKYGEDIADEIESQTLSTLAAPQHTAEVLRKHAAKTTLKRTQQNMLLGAHQTIEANLQTIVAANPDPARTLE